MTTVVTGWTGRAYDALGEQFVRTFDKHWHRSASRLFFYVDRPAFHAGLFLTQGGYMVDSIHPVPLSECDGLAAFVARHMDNPCANGRGPSGRWKSKELSAGYSFRFDAVRFATQMFIPEAAATRLPDGEIMAWFDADVLTSADVPPGFVEGLLGDADICFLGREPSHSELGFWAVRLNMRTRRFLRDLADIYRSDGVFALEETHSAFVFDHVRRNLIRFGLNSRNLTPNGRGHVWPASPLGKVSVHLKGKSKWEKKTARPLDDRKISA